MSEATCGKGLAQHAVLPAAMSRLVAAMRAVLEDHLDSLDPEAPASQPERVAYGNLVIEYRALAGDLERVAREMDGYRDLPMAVHDQARLASPGSAAKFLALIQAERDLLQVLQSSADAHGAMLDGMPVPGR